MKGNYRGNSQWEKQFIDDFQQLCRRHNPWKVWQDFIDMSACSIANSVNIKDDIWKSREEHYLNIVKRYSKEELDLIVKLFSDTVMALDENPAQDFLGHLYMMLDFGKGWSGQFFTPWHVAEMMAKITAGDNVEEQIKANGYVSVNDPACGAGVMLMAFAHVCRNDLKLNYQTSVLFIGQDLDPTVAKMCYIQLSLLGCAGYVVIGNSLTECVAGDALHPRFHKPENIWFTPMWYTDIWMLRQIRMIGSDIVDGLAAGIENPQQEIVEAVKTIATPAKKPEPQRKKPVKPVTKKKTSSFSWKDFLKKL